MAYQMKVFQSEEFGQVRTRMIDGKAWFVARDICYILGISNYRDALTKLDDDERESVKVDTLGGPQAVNAVNESGLYSLIMRSNKPNAKKFRKWVTSEVLPSIRANGMYAVEELLDNPDVLLATVKRLKEEREKRVEAERKIAENKPKVAFAEAMEHCDAPVLIRDWIKAISDESSTIGQNRAFQWLRDKGYLMADNRPYQRYIDYGWFTVREILVNTSKGSVPKFTTKITGSGQVALTDRIKEDFEKSR